MSIDIRQEIASKEHRQDTQLAAYLATAIVMWSKNIPWITASKIVEKGVPTQTAITLLVLARVIRKGLLPSPEEEFEVRKEETK